MNPIQSRSNEFGIITSTGRDKIHPINAEYLCSKLPHRVYADTAGAVLELTVRPIAQTVLEKHITHGGIIGIHYQTSFQQVVRTILLARDGNLAEINEYGYLDPCILDDTALYMLLNPVDLDGWYHLPFEHQQQMMEDIGMSKVPAIDHTKISDTMQMAIRRTQEQYRYLLGS
jgi:hypothetical protein